MKYKNNGVSGWCLLAILLLMSCNSERKALKPYKSVLTDIDTNYATKKKDLLAAIVDAKMPNKSVKETIVKYLPGTPITVKDTVGILRLANYYENKFKGKQCYTGFELDSIVKIALTDIEPTKIYITDTINNSTKETVIDTTGNYYKQKELELLRKNYNKCENDNKQLLKISTELAEKQTNLSYLFGQLIKVFLKKFWWLLLLAAIGIIGRKYVDASVLGKVFKFFKK